MKKGLLLLLLLCPPLLTAEVVIPPYFAKYEVLYNGLKLGELTQQLSPVIEGRQAMQSKAYTTGLAAMLKADTVTQFSLWLRERGRLLPVSYDYHYSGSRRERSERQEFDWSGGKVKALRDGVENVLALEGDIFDKQLVQIALRRDLLQGQKEYSYPVVDGNRLRSYSFTPLGDEEIQTDAFGSLRCLKLQRGETLFWLAPGLDYLPVRIEKDEGGITVTSAIVEYQPQ